MHKKPLRYFYRKGLFVFCPLFSREEEQLNYLIINASNYLTIALTASSPSTATTTTP